MTLSNPFSLIFKELQNIYKFRYVTYAYVTTNIRLRYRRSYLGFFWTVLAPMSHYLIMGFVFTLLMGRGRPGYFEYYFTGALFFAMISGVLNRAVTTFIINEHFLKKIYVPKLTFVVNSVGIELTNFLFSGTSLILLGMAVGRLNFSPAGLLSIIPVVLGAFALTGIACLVSTATVYFRDFINIIPAVIQAAFFATPVIYDETMIPQKYLWLMNYNPLYYLLKIFRDPLVNGVIPPLSHYVFVGIFAFVTFAIGVLTLIKFDNRIVFKL